MEEALREQEVTGIPIGDILVKQGTVNQADVTQAIREQTRFLARLQNLRAFLRKTGLKLRNLAIPAVMTVVVAGLDVLSIGLLIPILKGIIGKNFSFVKSIPVLKNILAVLPPEVSHNNTSLFLFLICLVFLAAVAQQGSRYFVGYFLTRQMQQFMHGLRKLVFKRYLGFGKMFFDKTSFGRLSTVLLGFTRQVSTQVQNLQNVLISVFTLILYISVMFFISWELTAILLLLFPILHFGLKVLVCRVKSDSKAMARCEAEMSKKVFDVVTCMPLIKAYNSQEKERMVFNRISNKNKDLQTSIRQKILMLNPVQQMFMLLVMLGLISIVALIVVKNKTADFSGFLVYFYMLKKCESHFGAFNGFRVSLANVQGPLREIAKQFCDEGKYAVPSGQRIFKGLNDGIRFEKMTFSYGEGKDVLRGIDLDIPKGKMTAIVGHTGSGKTTLVNLLMRFYDCPGGALLVDGVDIREISTESLMEHIALVSQDAMLLNTSLKDNISYGLSGVEEEELADVIAKARLKGYIEGLPDGMETIIGDRGVQLSGGEKQRIMIARAILKKTDIIVLDEATSSLDSRTESLIQESISEAIRGKTTIVIAHRLSTIRNADKIVVLEDGRIEEEGTMDALLEKKGIFYQYWEGQKFF